MLSHPIRRVWSVNGNNLSGAVNQQERLGIEWWTVGFVDGEGCFSISVVRNRTLKLGWQVQHEFSVAQSKPSVGSLELLREVFDCGSIIENRRHDDHRYDMCRFSVKRRSDLITVIVPFFETRPLMTAKRRDLLLFAHVLSMMERGEHLTRRGLRSIALITEQMNRRPRSRYLESSEAIRQPST